MRNRVLRGQRVHGVRVLRALTLGEIRIRDWWRVVRREFFSGLVLGTMLGLIGFMRVIIWQAVLPQDYPTMPFATMIFFSLVGVVMFGTLTGALLPIILRKLGFDPASASAPLVATMVDVTGLIIYFLAAKAFVL